MTSQILATVPLQLGDRRFLAPGRLRWLRAVGWMIALFVLVAVGPGLAMGGLQYVLPKGDPRIGFVINLTGAAIALGLYLLAVHFGEDRAADELAPAPALAQLSIGLALGTAMFACVMAILVATGLYQIAWQGAAPAWRAAGGAIRAGVIEELLVRAIMLRLLWRAFGPAAAFIVSVIFFGGAHLLNPGATWFAALCVALEAGVTLGAFYALTGRVWMSIGLHTAWNFTQGYLFGAAVSGTNVGSALAHSIARADALRWATGGAFGPESSLAALLVCTTIGLATLWLAYRAGRLGPNAA
jgi:hypothetical protein